MHDEHGDQITFFYEAESITDSQAAALQAAAAALPPITEAARVVVATIIPSPGRRLDLGTGAFRYDTVFCETVNVLSDARLKEDIAGLQNARALVDRLRPVSFRYIGKRRTHMGFLAQEVRDALGDEADSSALWCESPVDDPLLSGLPAGTRTVQSLRPDQLIAVLVRCCQEQDDLICDLQTKCDSLEEKHEALSEQVARHTTDLSYCYETIDAIQKAIRERPPRE